MAASSAFKVQGFKELKRVLSAERQLDMTNWSTPFVARDARVQLCKINAAPFEGGGQSLSNMPFVAAKPESRQHSSGPRF